MDTEDAGTKELAEQEVKTVEVIVEKMLPPVYSRQLKLFGIVIWSDTRQLDEDMFYDRVTARLSAELAQEVIKLRAHNPR